MFTDLVNEPAAGKVAFKVKTKSQKGGTDTLRTHALSVYPSGAPHEYAKVSLLQCYS